MSLHGHYTAMMHSALCTMKLPCKVPDLLPALAATGLSKCWPDRVALHPCRWEKGRKYVAVVCCFAGFLYCNVKALQVRTLDCGKVQLRRDLSLQDDANFTPQICFQLARLAAWTGAVYMLMITAKQHMPNTPKRASSLALSGLSLARSMCQWTPSSASAPASRWWWPSSSTSSWGGSCPPCAPGSR